MTKKFRTYTICGWLAAMMVPGGAMAMGGGNPVGPVLEFPTPPAVGVPEKACGLSCPDGSGVSVTASS